MTGHNGLDVDVLVVGGGMAGMTAAAVAARAGADVVVVDAAAVPGGSALLSGGIIWAPLSVDAYCELDQNADPALIRLVVESLEPGIEAMRSLGVDVQPPMRLDHALNYPAVGYSVDLLGYLDRSRSALLANGGHLVTEANVESLIVEDGVVLGAFAVDRDGGETIASRHTVVATGGFQGSRELRRAILGDAANDLVVRSNATSQGGGFRLATAAGAAVNRSSSRFYGNLLPTGLPRPFVESDFLRLSQYHSIHALLVAHDGARVGDESLSYYENAWLVSRTAENRALLIGDRRTRELGMAVLNLDRVAEAIGSGARAVEATTTSQLGDAVADWGYEKVEAVISAYNEQVQADPDALEPPRRHSRGAFTAPPYFAVEVQGAITFPFSGIMIDDHTRVLDERGAVIPGLLAAGVDASVYHTVYGGGLSLALATGLRAGLVASGQQVSQ